MYKKIWHRTSSTFRIFSKPGVYLSQQKRGKVDSEKPARGNKKAATGKRKKKQDEYETEEEEEIEPKRPRPEIQPPMQLQPQLPPQQEHYQQVPLPTTATPDIPFFTASMEASVAFYTSALAPTPTTAPAPIAAEKQVVKSPLPTPKTAFPLQNLLSPVSPFQTPRGLITLSFSQSKDLLNDSQNSGSQKFDNLFSTMTSYPYMLDDDDDDGNFYTKHIQTSK